MGTGYTRTNTSDIQADEVVKSAPLNAELNAVVNAFASSTGHSHDGTSAEGAISVSLGIVYDFENTEILNPSNVTFSAAGTAAVYGSAIFDTTQVFDGNPSPVETALFTGSGKSISFRFVAEDTNASHSIQGFTITFGMGDLR